MIEKIKAANLDIKKSWVNKELWLKLAFNEIKQRYRRSTIGPLWITISLGMTVLGLGLVYSQIFNQEISRYLPYVAIGLVVWNYIASVVNDGVMVYLNAAGLLRQVPLPKTLFIYQSVTKNLIIMLHNIIIILVVMIVFEITPSWRIVCIIPYWFMCILLTSIGITQILSIIGCRYRDFTQIVANLMQVMFFITPVMFSAKMISGRALLIKINPFYYYIEILRGGLLNEPVEVGVFIICGLISVCVFASGYLFFAKYRNRIVYWL